MAYRSAFEHLGRCASSSQLARLRHEPAAKQKRPFQVEIEAKVTVLAFDEASARKKIERPLAAGSNLGTDVEGTGAVWT